MATDTNIGALLASLELDTKEFQKGIREAKKQMEDASESMSKSLDDVGKSFQKVGGQMKKFGKQMTMMVTLPIIAMGTAAVRAEMNFESFLTKIISLVGVSSKQVAGWRDEILTLSSVVGRAPEDLADAMYFITSAGLRGAQALDALKQSARASAVGMGSTKVIADLVTDAMNAFGSENVNAAQAMDILVNAVRLGKVEAEDLVASMGHVFPVAAKLGVSFNDVAASIAAMTRTGTPAETAAVQIRQFLSQLIGPSKQAEGAFRTLSNAMDGTKISAKILRETLVNEGLFASLSKFNDAIEQVGSFEMAKDIFGNIRALTGVFDIMGKNLEDNAMIFEEMANSVGKADRAFEIASKTLKFKWDQAIASAKVNLIAIGEQLKEAVIPLLEDLIIWLRKTADWFTNLTKEQQKTILKTAAIVAALGPVIIVLGQLVSVLGSVFRVLAWIGPKAKAAFIALKGISFAKLGAGLLTYAGAIAGVGAALAGIVALSLPSYTAEVGKAADATQRLLKATEGLQGGDLGKALYDKVKAYSDSAKYGAEELRKAASEAWGGFAGSSLPQAPEIDDVFSKMLSKWSLKETKAVQQYLTSAIKSISFELVKAEESLQNGLISQDKYDAINKKLQTYHSHLVTINNDLAISEKAAQNLLDGTYGETNNFFKRLKGDVNAVFASMTETEKAAKRLGEPFDMVAQKTEFLKGKINELLSPENQFKIDSTEVQYLFNLLEKLGVEGKDIIDQLGIDIAQAFFDVEAEASVFKMLGEEIDVDGAKLKALKGITDDVLNGDYGSNIYQALNLISDAAENLVANVKKLSILDELAATLRTNAVLAEALGLTLSESLSQDMQAVEASIHSMIASEKYSVEELEKLISKYKELGEQLNTSKAMQQYSDAMKTAVLDLTSAFGYGLVQSDNFFGGLLSVFGRFMQKIGEIIVTTSAAWQKFQAALLGGIPGVGIAVGMALIAAGAALSAFGSASSGGAQQQRGGSVAFADGGLVYGPTFGQIGEYPGARSNPEVVAPLDKLTSMISSAVGSSGGEWETAHVTIPGDKLDIVLKKVYRKRERM